MVHVRRLPWVLPLLAACQDQGLKPVNSAPSAAITAPTGAAPVPADEPVLLSGIVGDADDTSLQLTARWAVDGVERCDPEVDPAGLVSCEVTLAEGTHDIALSVTDPAGATGTAELLLTASRGEPPTAHLDRPGDGEVYAFGTAVLLEGTVADAETAAELLLAAWEDAGGVALPISAEPDSTGRVTGLYTFEPGAHLLTLRVVDEAGLEGTASVTFTVEPEDTVPACVITAPAEGADLWFGDEVTLQAWVSDAETATTVLDVDWSSDVDGPLGTSVADSAGVASLSVTGLSPGTHSVSLAVTDEVGHTCADAHTLRVLDPPVIELLAPTDGEVVAEGSTVLLQAQVGDSVDPPSALTLTWDSNRDGRLASPTPDATGLTSAATPVSVGPHVLSATVTDLDGLATTAVLALTVDGAPSAPLVSLDPAAPGTDDELRVTLTTPSVDPEGAAVSYRYDWYVDGLLSTASTTSTLPASATTRGETWRVVVTPSDALQDGPSGEASVAVDNTTPVVAAATLTPATAYTDDTLTAAATTTDADGDPVSVTWTWYVDGVAVGATGVTLAGTTWFDKHQVVYAVAVPDDGTETGAAVATAPVAILNSPPGAPTLDLSPADPVEGQDDLWCAVVTEAVDDDGDAVSYTVAWDVDGATFSGATTTTLTDDTVPAAETLAAERWTCTVTPADDDEAGVAASVSADVLGEPVDYAHVQYPCSGSAATGSAYTVYAWVWMAGVTDALGEGTRVDAEVGVGPDGTWPWVSAGWTWYPAAYHGDTDGPYAGDHANDEYAGTLTAPATTGAWDYAYRFTTDGGLSWTYTDLGGDACGLVGTTDGYDPATAGALTVY